MQVGFGDIFHIGSIRQRVGVKAVAKKMSEGVTVGQKPGFHTLHHQVDVVIAGPIRPAPIIAAFEESLRPTIPLNAFFAVHQQDDEVVGSGVSLSRAKSVISITPAAARYEARHSAFESGLEQEFMKAPAAFLIQPTRSTAFDVNFHTHQRLPPSSPERQSSPSR